MEPLNEWLKPLQVGKQDGKRKVRSAVKSGPAKCSRHSEQSSPDGPMAPHAAVAHVDTLMCLSGGEKSSLLHELLCTDLDLILVLKENPAWNALFPGGSAAVINAIATWNLPQGAVRRDSKSPAHFLSARLLSLLWEEQHILRTWFQWHLRLWSTKWQCVKTTFKLFSSFTSDLREETSHSSWGYTSDVDQLSTLHPALIWHLFLVSLAKACGSLSRCRARSTCILANKFSNVAESQEVTGSYGGATLKDSGSV